MNQTLNRTGSYLTLAAVLWFVYLATPFFAPLSIGASLAILVYPIHLRLSRRMKRERAALLVTGLVTLIFIFPAIFLGITGVRAGVTLLRSFRESGGTVPVAEGATMSEALLSVPWVNELVLKVSGWLHMEPFDLVSSLGGIAKNVALKFGDLFTSLLSSIPMLSISTFLMLLALFFLLVDGERFTRYIISIPIFPHHQMRFLLRTYSELSKSVLLASVLSGVVQATIYLIATLFAGTSNVPFFGLLVFLGSFIPVVGASPITFGLAVITLFTAPTKAAGITLLVAAVLASLADNIVRPVVLRGSANLHPLLALIGLFGGLHVFGFVGIFVGPVVAGMAVAFLKVWMEIQRTRSPKV